MTTHRKITLEIRRDDDGRWSVPLAPDVVCRATTRDEVIARAQASALRTLARRIEQGMLPAQDLLNVLVEVRECTSGEIPRDDAE